jgi:hypothetical protein
MAVRRGCVLLGLLAACAAPPPPQPPPFAGQPPGPPDQLGEVPAPVPVPVPAPVPAPAPASAPPSPPKANLAIEPPFRLDRRVIPPTRALFLADLEDRTRWNKGDLGPLAAPLPPVPGHPAPKVILDVSRATGPRTAADLQRVLRKGFWIKAVTCFAVGAYKDQKLRGTASLLFGVSAEGRVSHVRVTQTTFPDADVPTCLAEQLRAFALPRSKGRSTVAVDLQIGHGDEPVPPPASLVVPGDGELAPDAVRAVVDAARPALTGCYEAALAYAPGLWGRLGVRFHVTEKGKTDEAFEAESQFPDERVALCVLREARKLVFPKPAGGDLRFVVPLRFWSDRSALPDAPSARP